MPPFHILGPDRPGRWLVTCDHASNRVPEDVCGGDLGVSAQDMTRHIAWDVGARGLAEALGAALNSPVICSDFSRLVIDANRGEDDPTLVMQLYDGTIIPGNAGIGDAEVARRLQTLHRLLSGSRYPVSLTRLMDELGCSRATVYRDIAYLRDGMGAPVEKNADPEVGVLEKGFAVERISASRTGSACGRRAGRASYVPSRAGRA